MFAILYILFINIFLGEHMNNFQRIGAISNAHVGKNFEDIALKHFKNIKYDVKKDYPIQLGFSTKKQHRFDLGGTDYKGHKVVIECKSHKWTSGDKVPSAKMTVWNEVMLYFSLVSRDIKKVLFVLKDKSPKRQETLARYYIRTYSHLIPKGVIIMEFDEVENSVKTIYSK